MSEINYDSLGGFAISKELIDWIWENIPEGSTILELGSGYGTKELVKKYNVYSIEHDEKWMGIAEGSNYIYAPLKNGWYDREILIKEIPKKYDVLLIDGPPNIYRGNFVNHYDLFQNVKTIIVDDTHRNNDSKIVESIVVNNKCIFEEHNSERKKFIVIKKI
jgi:hypothetical protein